MKIVCESCGAKYSIADDRVAGKMFKIRCKKCSEVIVVRGDQQAAAAEPAAAPAQSQAAIWHVVVEGEQAGPYAPAQLAEMLTNGTVDWEAYVWTEGFDNWAPMRDVADLVAQITGQPQQQQAVAAAAGGSGGYRPAHETLTGQPSMGADPFADDAASGDHGLFGGQPAAAEMFARAPAPSAASAFGGGEDPGVVSSSPSPRLSAERVMTGARNENSVLFSLKNLQALATGSGTPSSPAPSTAGGGGGFAGGEGSGLIDIRALASTTGVGENGNASGHKDELLSIGSQGGAFGSLGSPMLAAVAGDDDGNKKMMIWAIVAAVGMLSVAAVAVVYFLRPQAAPGAPQGVGVDPNLAVVAPPVAQQPVVPTPTAAPSEGELAAQRAAAEHAHEPEKAATSGTTTASSHHKHTDATGGAKTGGSETAIPEPETKKPAPTKSGPKSIDELLDGALGNSSAPKAAKPTSGSGAGDANLPDTPSRESALAAMNAVKPAVQACAKGENGVALVDVSVAGASGHVTTAQVKGVTGPAGSCIAQAVRKANFPKFRQSVFKLTFPFKL